MGSLGTPKNTPKKSAPTQHIEPPHTDQPHINQEVDSQAEIEVGTLNAAKRRSKRNIENSMK